MALLSAKDIEALERSLGRECATKWEGIGQKNNAENIITIANTGLFSSGKSMLFNALLDQTKEERFKVGAAPTTKKGDREKLNSQIEIIDTPGINANDADDSEAFHSLMEADIILMVHNLKTGMLDKCEHDWLKRIAGGMDRKEIQKRLVFVCTWVDEAGTKEDKEKKGNEIMRQLREIFHMDIDFWEISSKRYYAAKEKNKPELENASRIPLFKEYLMKKAEEYAAVSEELRKKEILALCTQTRESLQKERKGIGRQIKAKEERVHKKYSTKKAAWASILSNFKDYRATVWEKMRKVEAEEEDREEYEMFKDYIMEL